MAFMAFSFLRCSVIGSSRLSSEETDALPDLATSAHMSSHRYGREAPILIMETGADPGRVTPVPFLRTKKCHTRGELQITWGQEQGALS